MRPVVFKKTDLGGYNIYSKNAVGVYNICKIPFWKIPTKPLLAHSINYPQGMVTNLQTWKVGLNF